MTARATQSPRLAGGNARFLLSVIAFIIIVTIALLRCVIVFAPQTVFDVDPAASPGPWGGMGMAGSLLLDVMMLFSCALALFGEWRSGRGVNIILVSLALIPVPIIFWHGAGDAGDLWLGSCWLSAMLAAVTLLHLARDQSIRIMLFAALLAIACPLLLRGISQITWEHHATVAEYQRTKEQFLQFQGWERDSPAVKIYERRLMQPQPLGWFATTNILATMLASVLVGAIALMWSSWRARLPSGWTGVVALLAGGCGALLAFTGSKGAVLAVGAGMVVLVAMNAPRLRSIVPSRPGAISIALILLAILGVVIRGAMLPESFLGDKSLLFRWHYWLASMGIVAHNLFSGVGPDGFQAVYTMFRLPRNPEEVASAHNVFLDWIATLGLSGAAWVLLVCILLLMNLGGGRDDQEVVPVATPSFVPVVTASLLVAIGSIAVEWPVLWSTYGLDMQSLAVRLLGFGLLPVVAVVLIKLMGSLNERETNVAILAVATTTVVHAQIEMTMSQPGPPAWALALLAACGAAGMSFNRNRRLGLVAAIVVALVAAWTLLMGAMPAASQQRMMEQAAALVRPIAQNRDDEKLILQQRRAAADQLVKAYDRWPINVRPMEAAVIQLELASARQGASTPVGLVMQSADLVDRAIAEHQRPSSISLGVVVHSRLAQLTGDHEHWARSIELARRLTQLDPNGLGAWRRLGDVQWMANEKAQAAEAYRRALECDANFALDELKQLSEKDRTEIQRRIRDPEGSLSTHEPT